MNSLEIEFQPKQAQLMDLVEAEGPTVPTILGFGGARGGGKSGALRRIMVLRRLEQYPGTVGFIVRRIYRDLEENHIEKFKLDFPQLTPWWRQTDKEYRFGNGSRIAFLYGDTPARIQGISRGPECLDLFIDQAEQFTDQELHMLGECNRWPGVKPGAPKRCLFFNPGGPGTSYLRRIFWSRDYHDNEDGGDYRFIHSFGWENYEWFRGLNVCSAWEFYNDPEWTDEENLTYQDFPLRANRKRFELFVNESAYGRILAGLPASQRIGELFGSFEKFSGQYFGDVWDEQAIVLPQELVARIVQPWWRRWLATDWGFSHYAATGWFASGMLSPDDVARHFRVTVNRPVRIIVLYRELITQDVTEPDLAQLIVSQTPEFERREIRMHFMGHDAWAKRGSSNTVQEQMDPVLTRGRLQPLSRASIDRVAGWRMLYNCWGAARKLRTWNQTAPCELGEHPCLFVSANCPEVISAVPMLICDDEHDNPLDVRKVPGAVEDDVADMCRYAIASELSANPHPPDDVIRAETYQRYQDPTARAMAMLKLEAEQAKQTRIARRRRY